MQRQKGLIIGPYFFENEDGSATTVTSEWYRAMLENVRPAVKDKPEMWFQQDGATAHTARATVELLRQIFGQNNFAKFRNFLAITFS